MNFLKNCLTRRWAGRGIVASLGGYRLWSLQLDMTDNMGLEMKAHISSLVGWTVFLYVIFWISSLLVRRVFYWRFNDWGVYWEFVIKVLLFFVLALVLCPILITNILNLGGSYWDARLYGKDNVQRVVSLLELWVLAYSAFQVFYIGHKKYIRKEKMMSTVKLQNHRLEKELFAHEHKEDLLHTFMFIRRGDSGYRLKNNGIFLKDKRRLKEMKDMLEKGYIEIAKGISVNKNSIERIDDEGQKVYLVKEIMEVLELMLGKYEELKAIREGIKSENGLLNLSPIMEAKLRAEGKLDNWLSE